MNTNFELNLLSVRNPVSTRPSSSIEVRTYDGSGYEVDSLTGGMIVTNDLYGTFTLAQLYFRSSDVVADTNVEYTFNIVPAYPVKRGYTIQFVLPINI